MEQAFALDHVDDLVVVVRVEPGTARWDDADELRDVAAPQLGVDQMAKLPVLPRRERGPVAPAHGPLPGRRPAPITPGADGHEHELVRTRVLDPEVLAGRDVRADVRLELVHRAVRVQPAAAGHDVQDGLVAVQGLRLRQPGPEAHDALLEARAPLRRADRRAHLGRIARARLWSNFPLGDDEPGRYRSLVGVWSIRLAATHLAWHARRLSPLATATR